MNSSIKTFNILKLKKKICSYLRIEVNVGLKTKITIKLATIDSDFMQTRLIMYLIKLMFQLSPVIYRQLNIVKLGVGERKKTY